MAKASGSRLDRIAIGLGVAFAGWVTLAGTLAGGRFWPMAALVAGAVAAVVAAGRLRAVGRAAPALVAVAPLLALVFHRSDLLDAGPLGYSNASGALYFVAACAAVTCGRMSRHAVAQGAWYLLGVTWLLAPWKLGADAAAAVTLLLPAALFGVRSGAGVRRLLLAGGVIALAGLGFTAAAGAAGYEPGARETAIDRWLDDNLGDVRFVLWRESLELVRERPLLGVGPGRFRETSPTALVRDDARWAHNEYLQTAAEAGLPGLLLLLGLAGWGFVRLSAQADDPRVLPAAVALGGVALHANIDFIWHFAEVPLALGLLVGAASAMPKPDLDGGTHVTEQSQRRNHPRIARAPLVATLALWIALLLPNPLINPPSTATNGAILTPEGVAVAFERSGIIRSARPPEGVWKRIMEAEAFTVEMLAASFVGDQRGPARIISASDGIGDRNFTLGQEGDRLVFRLRTSRTNANGSDRQLEVSGVFSTSSLRHLVVATDVRHTRVFVDGALRWSGGGPGGSLSAWDPDMMLLIGNESTFDRPWLGSIAHVAIYDEALADDVIIGCSSSIPDLRKCSGRPSPILRYAFPGDIERIRSDFEIPTRIPSGRRSLGATLLDAGGDPLVRVTFHAALLFFWGLVMALAATGASRPARLVEGALVGVALTATVTLIRYLEVRSPSIWDVVGAAAGILLLLLLGPLTHRQRTPE